MRLALVAAATVVSGCGPRLVPVSGIVTLDGKPLAGAYVMFVSESEAGPLTGRTDPEGRYSLVTAQNQRGAFEGDYKVCIALYEAGGGKSDPLGAPDVPGEVVLGGKPHRAVVPLKYTRPESSDLTAKVSRNQPQLDFALTSQ